MKTALFLICLVPAIARADCCDTTSYGTMRFHRECPQGDPYLHPCAPDEQDTFMRGWVYVGSVTTRQLNNVNNAPLPRTEEQKGCHCSFSLCIPGPCEKDASPPADLCSPAHLLALLGEVREFVEDDAAMSPEERRREVERLLKRSKAAQLRERAAYLDRQTKAAADLRDVLKACK